MVVHSRRSSSQPVRLAGGAITHQTWQPGPLVQPPPDAVSGPLIQPNGAAAAGIVLRGLPLLDLIEPSLLLPGMVAVQRQLRSSRAVEGVESWKVMTSAYGYAQMCQVPSFAEIANIFMRAGTPCCPQAPNLALAVVSPLI